MGLRRHLIAALLAVAALAAAVAAPGLALAHPNRPHMEEEEEEHGEEEAPPEEEPHGDEEARPVTLTVRAPSHASLGERVRIEATLTTRTGKPVEGATLIFLMPVSWGEWYEGEAEIGTALTNELGVASIATELRRGGDVEIHVAFEGDATYAATERPVRLEVAGDTQLYTPDVGLSLPGLGVWIVVLLLVAVWGLYFLVGVRLLGIARAVPTTAGGGEAGVDGGRRRLLRAALPVGMQAIVAGLGGGLLAMIARSPRTHGNLTESLPSGYRRTMPVFVGGGAPMEAMPEPLDREVSFSREVHPILLAKGGPHAVPPEHQPPPAGVRLDTYENMMRREGLVVPGKPMESELVAVLLDPAMRMPPSGLGLTDEDVRVIVSWVAQGARDN